jgi:aryl-alcohol dehydrogenase-like predicted oxidoreductase
VDRIDLYQLHWPPEDGTPIEDAWTAMAELVRAGKVRWIGVCNFTVELLDRCQAIRPVDTVQAPLSLIARQHAADIVPWCSRHGTAMLAYSPLQSGLLTGRFGSRPGTQLHVDDWRRRDPEFSAGRLERNVGLVERLEIVAADRGRTLAELAVAWVLAWPVRSAIVGARRPDQLAGWMGAATLELDDAELERITSAIDTSGAGEGPTDPRTLHRSTDDGR